jgi:mRNA interferase RelE/StbE
MPLRLEFSPKAARQFKDLPKQVQAALKPRLDALLDNPHSSGVIKLSESEYEALYRLRVGNYRVFFEIQEESQTILVVKVGHRREVYRK